MLINLLAGSGDNTMLIFVLIIVAMFVVMGVVNNKQRKKQMAEEQKKKDSLCVGTKVITIGGIVGKVVKVDNKKSTFVLETEGTKINFDKRAIYQMELPESVKKVDKEPVEEVAHVVDAPQTEEVKTTAKKPTQKKTATKKTAKPETEEKVEEVKEEKDV